MRILYFSDTDSSFVQLLIPETDEQGRAIKFYPQEEYRGNRKLHKYGNGAFCCFSIIAEEAAGVYLLTDGDRNILYIGETRNLQQRFNDSRFGSYGSSLRQLVTRADNPPTVKSITLS